MMKDRLRGWLAGMALGSAILCSGCAGTQERVSSAWQSLPSPWATLKSAKKQTTETAATKTAAPEIQKTADTKPAKKSAKRKADKEEQSVAMELLRGLNCEHAGEWDKARQIYEELRKAHPENVEVAHRLGVVADAQRHHAEAEQLFLFALEHDPRNADLLCDLGYCYFLQGRLPKAESALLKATVLEPKNQRHWNNLGLVLGHLGRHQEALECFRKAGSEADAQYNLAFVYAAQERVDEAKQAFQAALAADPTHRRAREALSSFEEYERLPKHLKDFDEMADNGVRYVPYIEGADPRSGDGRVMPASAQESMPNSLNVSRAARALHMESRGMLNRNMASQRSDEPAAH
jgi:tetratricopeptide (TPR) repeat protein